MLDQFSIYSFVDDFFLKFDMEKIIDPRCKYIDCLYIDPNREKYIFACKIFDNKYEMFKNWELVQDHDIALYLQNELFSRNDIRWDIYYLLIYIREDDLTIDEYHFIEKDRFCCKKYVIKAKDQKELIENFNFKLPLTSNFYQLEKLNALITDDQFFQQLREKVTFNKNIISDRILSDLVLHKNELVDQLKGD